MVYVKLKITFQKAKISFFINRLILKNIFGELDVYQLLIISGRCEISICFPW